ncbi:MAG: septum formation protein Maf [Verrucomicrobiae bacterium]|nr:septum formation protein Maf [Verrucomicrobiae bacterium]
MILASASPRRQELLARLGVRFRVVTSSVREIGAGVLAPHEVCLANAGAKAMAVARRHPGALVLGADTEVAMGVRVFGKPRNRREAVAFLTELAGRTHQVITGVCLVCLDRHVRLSFAETTHVTFHPLTARQVNAYVRETDPLDKAGAYAIQDRGEWIVEGIEGSLSNVIGLPLGALREALRQLPAEVRPAGWTG